MSDRKVFDEAIEFMLAEGTLFRLKGKLMLNHENEINAIFPASILWPIIDTYYIAGLFLVSIQQETDLDKVEILKKIQWLGEQLYEDRTVVFFESCNQDSIKNAVATFEAMKVIKVKDGVYRLKKKFKDEAAIKELLTTINAYRQESTVGPNPITAGGSVRRSLIHKYPFMAKL